MVITMKDVSTLLNADEVDYPKAKKLGPEAIPFLMELVQGQDLGLASKATYLASLINTEQSVAVVEAATASNAPVLRAAAASGIRNLPEVQAERILDRLRNDPDAGIRKVVLKSAEQFRSLEVEAKIQQMAETDPEPFVCDLAGSIVQEMRSKRQAP